MMRLLLGLWEQPKEEATGQSENSISVGRQTWKIPVPPFWYIGQAGGAKQKKSASTVVACEYTQKTEREGGADTVTFT